MSRYTPGPRGEGSLPPRSHRAKPKKKDKGCLMALPQVVVAVAHLVLTRRST